MAEFAMSEVSPRSLFLRLSAAVLTTLQLSFLVYQRYPRPMLMTLRYHLAEILYRAFRGHGFGSIGKKCRS